MDFLNLYLKGNLDTILLCIFCFVQIQSFFPVTFCSLKKDPYNYCDYSCFMGSYVHMIQ
jgi:hypothetical protein